MQKTEIYDGTWTFDEGGVRFFLLVGTERALLIDSGMQTHNALELAKDTTSLPVMLINTHADMDHTGSNGEFEEFYMSPAECVNYFTNQRQGRAVPVWDGDVIDLGSRPLKIVEIPGHTPGSIAILDTKNRRIFTGDPIQDGRIFMFGPYRNMQAYLMSARRLERMSGEFDEIYPSHGSFPLKPQVIPKLIKDAEDIVSGKAEGKEEEIFGGRKIKAYYMDSATFLCDAK